MRTLTITIGLSAVLLAPIFATGCGADESPDQAPVDNPVENGTTEMAASESPQAADGSLRLGDTTYEFFVRACDFTGEVDDDFQTLSGRGTTPDGEQFDVYVSRTAVGDMLMHTVSFQKGDVMRGEGTVIEAQRIFSGGTWTSPRGGPSEPLIHIEGTRLRASGRFSDVEMNEDAIDGEISATCA